MAGLGDQRVGNEEKLRDRVGGGVERDGAKKRPRDRRAAKCATADHGMCGFSIASVIVVRVTRFHFVSVSVSPEGRQ